MLKANPAPSYPPEEGRYLRGNDFSPGAVAIILTHDADKIPADIQALVRAGVESGAALAGWSPGSSKHARTPKEKSQLPLALFDKPFSGLMRPKPGHIPRLCPGAIMPGPIILVTIGVTSQSGKTAGIGSSRTAFPDRRNS
jgi:hypothetical protein